MFFFFEILLLSFLSVCPSVCLSVNKKVHTCIVRETWKIVWKYRKFFEKNQLGPSVCLFVIKKVHICLDIGYMSVWHCFILRIFFQVLNFRSIQFKIFFGYLKIENWNFHYCRVHIRPDSSWCVSQRSCDLGKPFGSLHIYLHCVVVI